MRDLKISSVAIVLLGASGDLAAKKTIPALFGLYASGYLPNHFILIGYSRTDLGDDGLRDRVRSCVKGDRKTVEAFVDRVFSFTGQYNDPEHFKAMNERLVGLEDEAFHTLLGKSDEEPTIAHRLFYFALPPSAYAPTAAAVYQGAFSKRGWSRLIVEKPFGRDLQSCETLTQDLQDAMGGPESEANVYRIDHYLGKEMVQAMITLRFANRMFEPLWNREHISNVTITFKEPFGTKGRGGYFDKYGIIRDVMQNHLMQVLALVAMEPPRDGTSEAVSRAKVDVLKCISEDIPKDNVVLGQYGPHPEGKEPAYKDDPSIEDDDSVTPTYCALAMFIDNDRWRGVPFIMKAGKALNERKTEVRIQFRPAEHGYMFATSSTHNNELVIKIQPGESVYAKFMCKSPGLADEPLEAELDLQYAARFPCAQLPDAYERLILEALRGDHSNFVGDDELREAWRIFTPLLHRIEGKRLRPLLYEFGSRGPAEAYVLCRRFGYIHNRQYSWLTSSLTNEGMSMTDALHARMRITTSELHDIVKGVRLHMRWGLTGDDRASIKMIPSFVAHRPVPAQGASLAVDLGGTNFRVIRVAQSLEPLSAAAQEAASAAGALVLDGGRCVVEEIASARIPDDIKQGGKASELFSWMAEHIAAATSEHVPLGFTFSFPVKQVSIDSGSLIHWTKDWAVEGVVDADVVALLNDALKALDSPVHVTALINDTVGTLMSGAVEDARCAGGVILGTGSNAAYIERSAAITKWDGKGMPEGQERPELMIVNTEWGGFNGEFPHGEEMRNVLPRTEIDRNVDLMSESPGEQLFEKMISGRTLGEIARRAFMQLQTSGELWAKAEHVATAAVTERYSLDTATLSRVIEAKSTADVKAVIEADIGVHGSSDADADLVRDISALVCRRSARLAAAGIAATAFAMRESGVPITEAGETGEDEKYSIGVDGSLFLKIPNYRMQLEEALHELEAPCRVVAARDGSGLGAGLIATATVHGTTASRL